MMANLITDDGHEPRDKVMSWDEASKLAGDDGILCQADWGPMPLPGDPGKDGCYTEAEWAAQFPHGWNIGASDPDNHLDVQPEWDPSVADRNEEIDRLEDQHTADQAALTKANADAAEAREDDAADDAKISDLEGDKNDLKTQHNEDQNTIEQLRRQLEKAKEAAKTATDNAEAENARDDQKIEDLQHELDGNTLYNELQEEIQKNQKLQAGLVAAGGVAAGATGLGLVAAARSRNKKKKKATGSSEDESSEGAAAKKKKEHKKATAKHREKKWHDDVEKEPPSVLGETPAGRDLLAGKIPEISTQRSKAGGKNVVSGLVPGMDLSVPTLPPASQTATAGAPTPPVAQTKTTVDVQGGGSKGGEKTQGRTKGGAGPSAAAAPKTTSKSASTAAGNEKEAKAPSSAAKDEEVDDEEDAPAEKPQSAKHHDHHHHHHHKKADDVDDLDPEATAFSSAFLQLEGDEQQQDQTQLQKKDVTKTTTTSARLSQGKAARKLQSSGTAAVSSSSSPTKGAATSEKHVEVDDEQAGSSSPGAASTSDVAQSTTKPSSTTPSSGAGIPATSTSTAGAASSSSARKIETTSSSSSDVDHVNTGASRRSRTSAVKKTSNLRGGYSNPQYAATGSMEDVDEERETDVLNEDADKSVNDDKADLDQQQATSTTSSKSNLNHLQRKSGPRFNQKLVSFFNRIFFGEESEKKEHDNVEEQAGKEEEEPPHLQLAQKLQLSEGENLKQSRIVETQTDEEQGGHNNFPETNEVGDVAALAEEDGEDGNTRSLSTSSAATDSTSQSYLNFLLNYGRWSSENEQAQGMNSAKSHLIRESGDNKPELQQDAEFMEFCSATTVGIILLFTFAIIFLTRKILQQSCKGRSWRGRVEAANGSDALLQI
ncbi:unnamed protein product [Amoebophrya sp. A120]|nr:unnamed protein product [Amoebophrya sp. A120]|eukprot:GSA120T00016055001.1